MFKFAKLRSKAAAHYQCETDNESKTYGNPIFGSNFLKKPLVDDNFDTKSVASFAESLFPIKPVTPLKKLERSRRNSINASLIPTLSDQSEGCPLSPVSISSKKSVEMIKEYPSKITRRNWLAEIDGTMQNSNGDSRKSFEPSVTAKTRNGESNRTLGSEQSQGFSDASNRSFCVPCNDDDESLDRSSSSASSISQDLVANADPMDYVDAEEKFLEANTEYFETLALENVRRDQYPKLGLQRHVYMDYANFALSSRFQMEEHMRIMMAEGHCLGSKSSHLLEHVADAQGRLLQMFNTSRAEYTVVFTTGFTAAYRLIAGAYPFQKGSPLLLCQDNHEAVRQLINASVKVGGKPVLAPLGENDLCMNKANIRPLMKRHIFRPSGSLFVYPAQSSITGIRHSLHWITKAHKSGWHVMLDVSTLLPTGNLDLLQHQPDFVVGSFQNMVGYPSGMGFLLVKRTSFCVSHEPSLNSITLTQKAAPMQGQDCHIVCEDKSLSLLLFAGLNLGLQHLQTVGLSVVNKRVKALSVWLVHKLKALRHKDPDNWHLVNVYSHFTAENRGNIISFNVLDCTGEYIMPALVQRLAARQQISLGVGTFNNPGVANLLGPVSERVQNTRVFERSWDFQCVQISLGPMSNFEDAYRLVQFLNRFRNQDYVSMEALGFMEETHAPVHFQAA